MLTVITMFGIGMALLFLLSRGKETNEVTAINGLITLLMMIFIGVIVQQILFTATTPAWEYDSRQPIASLKLKDTVSGDFILGSGSIKDETYYFVYLKHTDGTYTLEKYATDESVIRQQDGQSTLTSYKSPLLYSLFIDWKHHYEFALPTNSIIERYDPNP